MSKKVNLTEILGEEKSREEVMQEICNNSEVYLTFLNMPEVFREQFLQFCMGVRGMKMTYDTFFKHVFDAEVHPERLSRMLSQIIGRPLTVKRMLPTEHRLISEKGSLLILDIIVEFDTGELGDVEIQKLGYYFPGQRAACYAADMVMRQYERKKSMLGDSFTYQDMKKVYTIVFMENSSGEVKKIEGEYLHRGRWEFDSGLKLDLLTEFFFVSIDNFHKIEDNKEDTKEISELEAWIYFIGSDKPEHILKIVEKFPWFAEYYEDVAYFRYHPKEAIGMFSDALRKLDENTVNYMIDDMKQELEKVKNEMKEKKEQIKKAEEEIRKIEGEKQKAEQEKQKAEQEKQKAEQEKQKAEQEKQKAEQEKQKAKEEVTHIKDEMNKKMEEKDREIEELRKMLANK